MNHRLFLDVYTLNKTSQEFSYIHFISFHNHKLYCKIDERCLGDPKKEIRKNTNWWNEACQYCPRVQLSILYWRRGKKRTLLPCVLCLINIRPLPPGGCKGKLQFPIRQFMSGCWCFLVICMKETWLSLQFFQVTCSQLYDNFGRRCYFPLPLHPYPLPLF